NHLDVFELITLPGCDLQHFRHCDYDPYHCVLYFQEQTVHLAVLPDRAVVLLWCEQAQAVEFKTGRYDEALAQERQLFAVRHPEVAGDFFFATACAAGEGGFEHCDVHGPWSSWYVLAQLAPQQLLAIGVGLDGSALLQDLQELVHHDPAFHLEGIDAALAPIEAMGRISAPAHPELEQLRRTVVRGLHSMIDDSGAFRASIKAIYYLIWVRDSGFSFGYQAAAGWPHRLPELCRLLLANPTEARGDQVPPGRMFGQVINKDYGKYEEDGAFYVIWTLFSQWTQSGSDALLSPAHLQLLTDAVAWVEAHIWDEQRGLFGEYFADESPTYGSRDHGTDYAIGKPLHRKGCLRHEDRPVRRIYDIYINLLMHSAYTMLAAMLGREHGLVYQERAARLWPQLDGLLSRREDGLPGYGEMLMADGTWLPAPVFGAARSVYVWALTLPCFAPVADLDKIRIRLLQTLMAKPDMHFINGICGAIAAVDPWFHDEAPLLEMIRRIQAQAARSGRYLPMPGAMPEKFDAPEGNLYHDIRPQGFAMGAWLAAWSGLGLRRLPYGLALRPTAAYQALDNYPWRGKQLHFRFQAVEGLPALRVNGSTIFHSLQVPESCLDHDDNEIAIIAGGTGALLLRSSMRLMRVEAEQDCVAYHCESFGLTEAWFANAGPTTVTSEDGQAIAGEQNTVDGHQQLIFRAWGAAVIRVGPR
ncbi:MAG: hypothetical protein ACOCXJ_06250, partial [Planctomycetota bacterium]